MPATSRLPSIDKDIRDVARDDLVGFDAVLHLAGLSNDPLGDLNPDLTYEINHKASVRLAEYAKAAGVRRFVFSSSCSNYGAAGDDSLDETSPFNPVTPLRRLESPRRARHRRAGDGRVQPDLSAQLDCLWPDAADPLRSGGQQPGRLGGDDRAASC